MDNTIDSEEYAICANEEDVLCASEEIPIKKKQLDNIANKSIASKSFDSDDLCVIKMSEIPEYIFASESGESVDKNQCDKIVVPHIESKTFKKKFGNYIPLINSDTFNEKKLSIMLPNTSKGNFIIPIPVYKYNDKNLDTLLIQTSFFDVKKSKISYKKNGKFGSNNVDDLGEIRFDPTFFDNQIIDILLNFDNKLVNFVKSTYGKKYKCVSKLIYNKNVTKSTSEIEIVNMISELGTIKGKLRKSKFYKQYNKIVNYNISKKYSPIEQFDLSTMKYNDLINIFDRILTDNKEIRMLFEPFAWINLTNNTYGSYLGIIMIEVKYKNAKIYSVLDKNETSMKTEVINVEI